MKQKLLLLFIIINFHDALDIRAQSNGWIHSYSADGSVLCFTKAGEKLWSADGNAILLSTDNGMDWSAPDSGDSPTWASSIASDRTLVYAAIGPVNQSGYGIARSTDDGKSWTSVTNGFGKSSAVYAVVISGSNVIAGGSGIFISSDSGQSWQKDSNGVAGVVRLCMYLFVSGPNLLAVTDQGVLLSADNGMSWSHSDLPLRISAGSDLIAFQPIVNSGTLLFACNGSDTIFFSSDNGLNWALSPSRFPFPTDCLSANDSLLFAALGSTGNLGYSTNNGGSWREIGDTGSALADRISALVVSGPNLVYGSSAVGIHYWPLSELLGQSSVSKLIEDQQISASPNPTPGPITISGAAGAVEVTNVLGERVAGTGFREPGSGNITLDLSKLPAGTYFARIETASGVVVRKILKE